MKKQSMFSVRTGGITFRHIFILLQQNEPFFAAFLYGLKPVATCDARGGSTHRTHEQLKGIEDAAQFVSFLLEATKDENAINDASASDLLEANLSLANGILKQVEAGTGVQHTTIEGIDDYILRDNWSVRVLPHGLKIWYGDTISPHVRNDYLEIRGDSDAPQTAIKIEETAPNGNIITAEFVFDMSTHIFTVTQQSEQTPQ